MALITVTEHIRQHLLEQAGLIEAPKMPDLESLRESEWDPEFERLQRNRLIFGAFRYGPFAEHGDYTYDYVVSMRKRLERYAESGNLEHLVDIANLAMTEFSRQRAHGAKLVAVDEHDYRAQRV